MKYANKTQPKLTKNEIRAILTADIHLSHTPPVARSLEECWYKAQLRSLKQLCDLQEKYQVPIIVAGDIFHKHSPPPELINFALEHLPAIYAVPGQHDLPMHNYADIKKSAYWTMVKGDKVGNLLPDKPQQLYNGIQLHGFPWGFEPKPLTKGHSLYQDIAVIHKYLWIKDKGYQGAPDANRLKKCKNSLKGYDVCLFGDNHIPFMVRNGEQTIVNAGSLMRRNIDQIDYKPAVWLLKSDNAVEKHYLDCSEDKFIEVDQLKKIKIAGKSMTKFLENVRDLGEVAISFEEAVKRYLRKEKVNKMTEKIIMAAIEE